jgi:hypothetical protein
MFSSLQFVLSASSNFGWRMPAGVHGKAGSTPVPGLPPKVDGEPLVNDCRQFGRLRRMQEELHGHRGPRFDSRLRRQPQWSNGRTTMMFSPRDRRRRLGKLLFVMKGGRMLGGTTYPVTITSLPIYFAGLPRGSAGECWREYMDGRVLYTAPGPRWSGTLAIVCRQR